MAETMTVAQVVRQLKSLQAGFSAPILAGLRKGVRRARKPAQDRLRATGLGRALQAKRGKAGTPPVDVSVGRARMVGPEAFECSLQAGGMAGLLDAGGKIKPHKIAAKNGKALIFQGSRGLVVTQIVNHPGALVQAAHALRPALDAVTPGIAADIDSELQRYVERERLGG